MFKKNCSPNWTTGGCSYDRQCLAAPNIKSNTTLNIMFKGEFKVFKHIFQSRAGRAPGIIRIIIHIFTLAVPSLHITTGLITYCSYPDPSQSPLIISLCTELLNYKSIFHLINASSVINKWMINS